MYYRVYAKFQGQKQFQALDLSTGCQVNNLIYATLIPVENLERLKLALSENDENVSIQIRSVDTNKIVFSHN